MILKSCGSHVVPPAAAEEGEQVGGGRGESGKRRVVRSKLKVESAAPKAP